MNEDKKEESRKLSTWFICYNWSINKHESLSFISNPFHLQVSSKLDLKDEKHELDQSLDVDLDRVGGPP